MALKVGDPITAPFAGIVVSFTPQFGASSGMRTVDGVEIIAAEDTTGEVRFVRIDRVETQITPA